MKGTRPLYGAHFTTEDYFSVKHIVLTRGNIEQLFQDKAIVKVERLDEERIKSIKDLLVFEGIWKRTAQWEQKQKKNGIKWHSSKVEKIKTKNKTSKKRERKNAKEKGKEKTGSAAHVNKVNAESSREEYSLSIVTVPIPSVSQTHLAIPELPSLVAEAKSPFTPRISPISPQAVSPPQDSEPPRVCSAQQVCEPLRISLAPEICVLPRVTAAEQVCEPARVAAAQQVCEPLRISLAPQICVLPRVAAAQQVCELPRIAAPQQICEPPRVAAAQQVFEPPRVAAAQQVCESPRIAAAQHICEPPRVAAAQQVFEPPRVAAAQQVCESPRIAAAQQICEPPRVAAAQQVFEPPRVAAAQQVCESPRIAAAQHICEPPRVAAAQQVFEPPRVAAAQQVCEPPRVAAAQHIFESPRVAAAQQACDSSSIAAAQQVCEPPRDIFAQLDSETPRVYSVRKDGEPASVTTAQQVCEPPLGISAPNIDLPLATSRRTSRKPISVLTAYVLPPAVSPQQVSASEPSITVPQNPTVPLAAGLSPFSAVRKPPIVSSARKESESPLVYSARKVNGPSCGAAVRQGSDLPLATPKRLCHKPLSVLSDAVLPLAVSPQQIPPTQPVVTALQIPSLPLVVGPSPLSSVSKPPRVYSARKGNEPPTVSSARTVSQPPPVFSASEESDPPSVSSARKDSEPLHDISARELSLLQPTSVLSFSASTSSSPPQNSALEPAATMPQMPSLPLVVEPPEVCEAPLTVSPSHNTGATGERPPSSSVSLESALTSVPLSNSTARDEIPLATEIKVEPDVSTEKRAPRSVPLVVIPAGVMRSAFLDPATRIFQPKTLPSVSRPVCDNDPAVHLDSTVGNVEKVTAAAAPPLAEATVAPRKPMIRVRDPASLGIVGRRFSEENSIQNVDVVPANTSDKVQTERETSPPTAIIAVFSDPSRIPTVTDSSIESNQTPSKSITQPSNESNVEIGSTNTQTPVASSQRVPLGVDANQTLGSEEAQSATEVHHLAVFMVNIWTQLLFLSHNLDSLRRARNLDPEIKISFRHHCLQLNQYLALKRPIFLRAMRTLSARITFDHALRVVAERVRALRQRSGSEFTVEHFQRIYHLITIGYQHPLDHCLRDGELQLAPFGIASNQDSATTGQPPNQSLDVRPPTSGNGFHHKVPNRTESQTPASTRFLGKPDNSSNAINATMTNGNHGSSTTTNSGTNNGYAVRVVQSQLTHVQSSPVVSGNNAIANLGVPRCYSTTENGYFVPSTATNATGNSSVSLGVKPGTTRGFHENLGGSKYGNRQNSSVGGNGRNRDVVVQLRYAGDTSVSRTTNTATFNGNHENFPANAVVGSLGSPSLAVNGHQGNLVLRHGMPVNSPNTTVHTNDNHRNSLVTNGVHVPPQTVHAATNGYHANAVDKSMNHGCAPGSANGNNISPLLNTLLNGNTSSTTSTFNSTSINTRRENHLTTPTAANLYTAATNGCHTNSVTQGYRENCSFVSSNSNQLATVNRGVSGMAAAVTSTSRHVISRNVNGASSAADMTNNNPLSRGPPPPYDVYPNISIGGTNSTNFHLTATSNTMNVNESRSKGPNPVPLQNSAAKAIQAIQLGNLPIFAPPNNANHASANISRESVQSLVPATSINTSNVPNITTVTNGRHVITIDIDSCSSDVADGINPLSTNPSSVYDTIYNAALGGIKRINAHPMENSNTVNVKEPSSKDPVAVETSSSNGSHTLKRGHLPVSTLSHKPQAIHLSAKKARDDALGFVPAQTAASNTNHVNDSIRASFEASKALTGIATYVHAPVTAQTAATSPNHGNEVVRASFPASKALTGIATKLTQPTKETPVVRLPANGDRQRQVLSQSQEMNVEKTVAVPPVRNGKKRKSVLDLDHRIEELSRKNEAGADIHVVLTRTGPSIVEAAKRTCYSASKISKNLSAPWMRSPKGATCGDNGVKGVGVLSRDFAKDVHARDENGDAGARADKEGSATMSEVVQPPAVSPNQDRESVIRNNSKVAAPVAENLEVCIQCGTQAVGLCGACKKVAYCSNECMTSHWVQSHNKVCSSG